MLGFLTAEGESSNRELIDCLYTFRNRRQNCPCQKASSSLTKVTYHVDLNHCHRRFTPLMLEALKSNCARGKHRPSHPPPYQYLRLYQPVKFYIINLSSLIFYRNIMHLGNSQPGDPNNPFETSGKNSKSKSVQGHELSDLLPTFTIPSFGVPENSPEEPDLPQKHGPYRHLHTLQHQDSDIPTNGSNLICEQLLTDL